MSEKSSLPTGDNPVNRGRFAPSPTGRMHLGNVCAALLSWLSVKRKGGKWVLRIEDIDRQRSREDYARQLEEDLLWLGLEWDEGGYDAVGRMGSYRQSLRGEYYEEVLGRLCKTGLVYPCICTRAELRASSAPHQDDGRIIYSGRCRPHDIGKIASDSDGEKSVFACDSDKFADAAARIYVPDMEVSFTDMLCGEQTFNLMQECGDFILRRRDGQWAYQLAVVADDLAMGITEVVRGEDLLLSAAQQIYLFNLLNAEPPRYAHFPLIRNEAGQRLSKRDGSLSLEEMRKHLSSREIIGKAAQLSGLLHEYQPATPDELLQIIS